MLGFASSNKCVPISHMRAHRAVIKSVSVKRQVPSFNKQTKKIWTKLCLLLRSIRIRFEWNDDGFSGNSDFFPGRLKYTAMEDRRNRLSTVWSTWLQLSSWSTATAIIFPRLLANYFVISLKHTRRYTMQSAVLSFSKSLYRIPLTFA